MNLEICDTADENNLQKVTYFFFFNTVDYLWIPEWQ